MLSLGIGLKASTVFSSGMVTSGLVMWLDGTDTSTMTLTGSRVDEWRDKMGGANKVATSSAGTTFNPTYSSTLFSNKGGVTFTSKLLESPAAFTDMNWTTGFTVLAVTRKNNRASNFSAGTLGQSGVLGYSNCERLGTSTSGFSRQGVPRNIPCLIGAKITNPAANSKYILNGVQYGNDDGTTTVFTGAFPKLDIGGIVGSANYGNGEYAAFFFYNRVLSDQEISDMSNWIMNKYSITALPTPTWNFVIDGNSLAVGYTGANVAGIYDGFLAANGAPTAIDCLLMGSSGFTTPQITSRAATRIDTLYNTNISANKRIVAVWEITNDLALNATRTDVEAYNNMKTYCQARKAAGWKVVVLTCLPRTTTGNANANFETYRLSVNSMIRTNAVSEGWADAVADCGNDATIGVTGAYSNSTYFTSDGIHLRDAGHTIVKSYVTPAINSVTGL